MDWLTVVISGAVAAVSGAGTSYLSSFYWPNRLEINRERRNDGATKDLLKRLLDDPDYPDGRLLKTLVEITGTTEEECKRLLRQMGARGIQLQKGPGWVWLDRKPVGQ